RKEELHALRAQLVAAERTAIGEMAGAVAHGIRNPLANIRASAQVALLDCGEPGASLAARSLANIVGEVDLLDRRLRELLQFARPERHCEPMDVNAALRSAREIMGARLLERRVEV